MPNNTAPVQAEYLVQAEPLHHAPQSFFANEPKQMNETRGDAFTGK